MIISASNVIPLNRTENLRPVVELAPSFKTSVEEMKVCPSE